MSDLEKALDLIEAGDFSLGDQWDQAHQITQQHEGETAFDAVHALLHRIEGDTSNAAYWDRRAGTDFGTKSRVEELAMIRAMVAD